MTTTVPNAAVPHPDVPISWPCPPHLRISLDNNPHHGTVLRLEGELDLASGPAVKAAMDFCLEGGLGITADASGLSFIDAAGLRPLAEAQALAERLGQRFRIAQASAELRAVLRLTRHTHRLFVCTPGRPCEMDPAVRGISDDSQSRDQEQYAARVFVRHYAAVTGSQDLTDACQDRAARRAKTE
ncbi:STAS domain-containing protein [Streptomyces sp. NPDC002078]